MSCGGENKIAQIHHYSKNDSKQMLVKCIFTQQRLTSPCLLNSQSPSTCCDPEPSGTQGILRWSFVFTLVLGLQHLYGFMAVEQQEGGERDSN